MRRFLISCLFGLLFALGLLGISFATDGAGVHAHWLRDMFIGPPLWVLQTGLPTFAPSFAIEPGSSFSGAAFFALFFIMFWWLLCSAVMFALRRKPPNNAFKPKPLRGSA